MEEKALKSIGIEPIRSLNNEEKNRIIKQFVELLVKTFPKHNLNAQEITKEMMECQMYLANISSNLGTANYYHKNRSIYFSTDANLDKIDEYIIHECIHYFQDKRDKKGKLDKLGLCRFSEFKIYAMAMNESAIQYVTCKMLKRKLETIEYAGVVIKTISKNYYPLLTNLISQMACLVGEDKLVESVLFSTDNFILSFMDVAGEKNTIEIENGFDEILSWKQMASQHDIQVESNIAISFEKVQNQILTSYFDGMLPLLETVEEVEEYENKLIEYEEIIGNVDDFEFYENYQVEQLEKAHKKTEYIIKKKSKNMLAVVNNNKLFTLFKLVINFFKRRQEYRN